MVPTRTNAVRGTWEAPFAFADGRRDVNFIPCAGAKRLVHSSGVVVGTALAAGAAAARVAALGAYERRERYLDSVTPKEPAATTMEIPNTARCTGFRIHSPEDRI